MNKNYKITCFALVIAFGFVNPILAQPKRTMHAVVIDILIPGDASPDEIVLSTPKAKHIHGGGGHTVSHPEAGQDYGFLGGYTYDMFLVLLDSNKAVVRVKINLYPGTSDEFSISRKLLIVPDKPAEVQICNGIKLKAYFKQGD